MNRRAFIAAAPAAALAGTAGAAQAENPLPALYARWLAARDTYNESSFDSERETELFAALRAVEDQILAYPPQTVRDYAYKIIVGNTFFEIDGPIGDPFIAEARALIA